MSRKPPPSSARKASVSRRQALGLIGAATAAAAAPTLWLPRLPHAAERKARVVIAGGGFGGLALATALRALNPQAEIVVIDPAPAFFFAPSSLDVALGRMPLAAAMRPYTDLKAQGIRVVQGNVKAVDPASGRVETDAGSFDCTAFVLATGVQLAPGAIEGLAADPSANLSLYDRAALPKLAQRIAAFKGGTVVISVPRGALKCPPAPYEYAINLAQHFKARGIDGKVVLIDAWPSPQPDALGPAFTDAMQAAGDGIEYIAQEEVAEVDVGQREVVTGFGDRIQVDLLSLIPPNEATPLVAALDLAAQGDRFAAVDPLTFRTERHDTVFAIGDVARLPYGKSASAAVASAPVCAKAIAAMLAGDKGYLASPPAVELSAACYPVVDGGAFRLATTYKAQRNGDAFDVAVTPDIGTEPTADNAAQRTQWTQSVMSALFKS